MSNQFSGKSFRIHHMRGITMQKLKLFEIFVVPVALHMLHNPLIPGHFILSSCSFFFITGFLTLKEFLHFLSVIEGFDVNMQAMLRLNLLLLFLLQFFQDIFDFLLLLIFSSFFLFFIITFILFLGLSLLLFVLFLLLFLAFTFSLSLLLLLSLWLWLTIVAILIVIVIIIVVVCKHIKCIQLFDILWLLFFLLFIDNRDLALLLFT